MQKATGSYRTYPSLVKLQPRFLSLQWKTCLSAELQPWCLSLQLRTCSWQNTDDDDYYCHIYVTHASRDLQSHNLSGEGISCESHIFLTIQGHGVSPKMRDQLIVGPTSETARTLKTIHIIHTHVHSNKVDMRRMIMNAK